LSDVASYLGITQQSLSRIRRNLSLASGMLENPKRKDAVD
jgi:hypothetical protein